MSSGTSASKQGDTIGNSAQNSGKQVFATPDGTARFAKRATEERQVSESHFRQAPPDLTLSSLGMGSYLGDMSSKDDQLMHDAVIASITSGTINVIDTAINYRAQKSERSIGRALRSLFSEYGVLRDELFIASKNGFITPDGDSPDSFSGEGFRAYFKREFLDTGLVNRTDIAGGMHCMSPDYLSHQLDRSLQNLELECLDLIYLHNAAESQIPEVGKEVFLSRLEKAFDFYETARRKNKIRYYGLATWDCFRCEKTAESYLSLAEVIAIAEQAGGKNHGFRFIQLPFNLGMNEALTLNSQPVLEGNVSILEAAAAFGIGVFSSVPLLQGQLLSQRLPEFEGTSTPAQACLQFVRSIPGVLAPLVGHKQPSHVQDNLKLAQIPPAEFESMQEELKNYV
ncbi:MAG: aldo/keto reductase [Vampirovibrionales bacterium]|nr:aldo/keto reductase [Vampirovibrionales bacterium]